MPESPYERRLNEATKLIEQGLHRQAVETAGGGIDLLMKDLFEELKQKLNPRDAAALQGAFNSRAPKSGKLTSIRTLGGHRRYREAEVRDLLSGVPQQRDSER